MVPPLLFNQKLFTTTFNSQISYTKFLLILGRKDCLNKLIRI